MKKRSPKHNELIFLVLIIIIIFLFNDNILFTGRGHQSQYKQDSYIRNSANPLIAQNKGPESCSVEKTGSGSGSSCPVPPCGYMSCQDCQDAVKLINKNGGHLDKTKVCKDSNGAYCGNSGNPVPVTNSQDSIKTAAVASALVDADGFCVEINNNCVDDKDSDSLEVNPTPSGFSAVVKGKCKSSGD